MPIDKFEDGIVQVGMLRYVSCSSCGEMQLQLIRVRDEQGKKTKPAKYVCEVCNAKDSKIMGKV